VTELRLVTLAEARRWLSRSRQSRIDLARLRRMVADIEKGGWEPEAHSDKPVRIAGERLVNGHHRIVAMLITGQPLPMYIRFEKEP
jgi:hypothetical protein